MLVVGPNVLHIVLLGLAVPCVVYTLGEMRHWSLSRTRLAMPPLLAVACALVFLLIHLGSRQPAWMFGLSVLAGLAVGALRGFTVQLEVDHMFERIRLPRARGSFLIALVLLGAVLLEGGGALVGSRAELLRHVAPELAAVCAALLTGRAAAIAVRWRSVPHVDLRRK